METLVSQGMIVDGTLATDVSKVSCLQVLEDTYPMVWVIPPIDEGIMGNT